MSADGVLWIGAPGYEPEEGGADLVRELRPMGVILFGWNVAGAEQVHRLVSGLREASRGPLAVAMDQEGGRVDRLRALLGPSPAARELAMRGEDEAREFGALTGRALALLGVDVDFAPVVDLDRGMPGAIGDRSFGRDPALVSVMAGAFLDGLEAHGVRGCPKHFPGLGPAEGDPHTMLPTATLTEAELREDLEPFRALAPRVPLVMTAHAVYPAFAPGPATLEPSVLARLRDFGFRGAVVCDDLEMGALDRAASPEENARRALRAGCDAILACRDPERMRAAARGLEAEGLAERLEEARERIRAALPPGAWAPPWDAGAWGELARDYRAFAGV